MPYVFVSYYAPLEDRDYVLSIARRMGAAIDRAGLRDFSVSVSQGLPKGMLGPTVCITYDLYPDSGLPRDWVPFAWPPEAEVP